MTKREMLVAMTKRNTCQSKWQLDRAIRFAIKNRPKKAIEEVYRVFLKNPNLSGSCLYVLTGLEFPND